MSDLRRVINERFGGVLLGGSHEEDGKACALEALSAAEGRQWTDDPAVLNFPDVRPLNDAWWSSNAARTEAMVPLLEALVVWREWSEDRRRAWSERVALRTVREIVAELPGLPGSIRAQCRAVETLEAAEAVARAAARAAEAAEAAWAARAAWAAARAEARAAEKPEKPAWAARAAAEAAAEAGARAAEAAAEAGAEAAEAAAEAAEAAAEAGAEADVILRLACRIRIESAQEVQR